jgi:Domain of unknown function (DUF4865)
MIGMQYSFTLPADYDMSIIERRIRDKGPLLDGFPGLIFKAYLSAKRQSDALPGSANLYAPFYLWDSAEAMNSFLCGPGFAKVSGDFGWPQVDIWSVWASQKRGNLAHAKIASRTITNIAPYTDLASLRQSENFEVQQDIDTRGAIASVAAFDPTGWRLVRFQLWEAEPESEHAAAQVYCVGHVSLP